MENWLNNHVYGYQNLSVEEKQSIMHFSMLWSFFENYVLDTRANACRIRRKIISWEDEGRLHINNFQHHKDYFVQRYIENGGPNYRFQHLNLRDSDNQQLVQDVLEGSINDPVSVLTAILTIILRYRNNLFHGLKWEYVSQCSWNFGNTDPPVCTLWLYYHSYPGKNSG